MSIYERRKKKSQIKWDESPITDLCSNYLKSLTFTDENKKSWKTDESSTSKNNSTLSFYICAYTNSDEALSDSRNKNFQKSLLIQKQKQINPFSKFDLQNPYKCEFSDSLNDSIEGLIKKQNQINPASTFVCQVKYKNQ
uniref:Uncharacterized protein n=1 Tax=Panagrolaimus sp. PS1159 TaxID=55785 RepID=A0AC35GDH4_9BILA